MSNPESSEKIIKVLLVEDNPIDARLLRAWLKAGGPDKFDLTHVGRLSDAMSHLEAGAIDIALLDLGLPDAYGIEVVRIAHTKAPGIPLVVLTGTNDTEMAVEALQEGAQDYLVKGQIDSRSLLRAIRYSIERQRMQSEADHISKQQLQLKDEFFSHVSHELRSPLTVIYQFVTILADGLVGELNAEQRDCLQIALRNVLELQSMIDDLLEVTRAEGGKLSVQLQSISVSDIILEAVHAFQDAARVKAVILSSDIAADLPPAYVDPVRLRQILNHLIDNAIKFTPANGSVQARVRMFEGDAKFLVMEVSDTGCGLSQEMTERIFERLYQVPEPGVAGRRGLGLGLYICRELVTLQGGKIWVNSQQPGSLFSFTIPTGSAPDHFAIPSFSLSDTKPHPE